jgi:hypothetical protein
MECVAAAGNRHALSATAAAMVHKSTAMTNREMIEGPIGRVTAGFITIKSL